MFRLNIEIIEKIKNGGIGVIPTDTIYGLVCSAFIPESVEKIYELKNRNLDKPLIILISEKKDLVKFNISVDKKVDKYWPGPVSIILPSKDDTFSFIHRGTNSLAFRVPEPKWLRELLRETGPLVAPSANLEGKEPAHNIKEAKEYFGDNIDFYLDGGELYSKPSSIIDFSKRKERKVR